MCFNIKTLLANRRKQPAKTAAPSPLPLDTVPATTTTKKETTFADLPGEVRTEIYKLCIDSRRPFTTNDVSLIMPLITTPAICRVNRATRPEALAVFVSRARWAVTGGSPTALGETSTRNGLNVRGGAGVGLGCGPPKSVDGIPDTAAVSWDWVADRRQRFFPDDVALRTWAGWCAAIEALGREAENGISKLRVRAYAHAMCRPELVDIGGIVMGALWNEYGLLEWDVDLIENKKKKRAFVKGRLTKRMVPVVAAAEDFLEELVAPLREKRVLGLLRAWDVRVLVETFVAYVADMGLSEETAFLKKIAF
ncbi:hypothetical protein SLS55_001779 [Diplodia seriata]|uniref:Uncharacterized protein n=1 Tax=Diplodia seriata TaxID=420778 RepID=A0ABR3CQB8_9PEZI